jgi:hypothetical protein
MGSMLDWLSEFYTAKRNPYLRLTDVDRRRLGTRAVLFFVVVAVIFGLWWLLRSRIAWTF